MTQEYSGNFGCRFFYLISNKKIKKTDFLKKTIYNELLNEYVSLINIVIVFNIFITINIRERFEYEKRKFTAYPDQRFYKF